MLVLANILQPLVDIAESILVFLHNDLGFGWGMSIVGLTIIVRIVLLPLSFKQFRSMQAMQKLQPEIKKIQAKYKDDRQKMNQEMMKFYQENKVNPMGSCLPLVLQIPVFISLFYLLRDNLSQHVTENKGWLFIDNLTEPATGAALVVLIVIFVLSQVGSTLLMASTMDKRQKMLMLALPLVFIFFIVSFPAGLVVYWTTTNIWTVGQQLAFKAMIKGDDEKVAMTAVEEKKTPPPPPKKKKRKR